MEFFLGDFMLRVFEICRGREDKEKECMGNILKCNEECIRNVREFIREYLGRKRG